MKGRTKIALGIGAALVVLVALTSTAELHRAIRAASLPAGAYVLPKSTVYAMAHPCARPAAKAVEAGWTPEAGEIAELEAALPAALAAGGKGAKFEPRAQVRQYVGVERNGRRIVLGNVVSAAALPAIREGLMDRHPEHDPDRFLAAEPIFVCDRIGAGYGFEWDPAKGRIAALALDSGRMRHVTRYAYDVAPTPEKSFFGR